MAKLRAGVIGAGHLGTFHAQKYAASERAELRFVADLEHSRAVRATAGGAAAAVDYRPLLGSVDVVSIAVPARLHHAVASECLAAGLHVLLEKPIAATVEEGRRLVELAAARQRVLQIGHLERFNPAVLALGERLGRPLFIDSHRIAPYQPRGTDVNVVLDLMIHDIDLLLALVDAPVTAIDACGSPVLTDDTDIANARLRFADGCVANITASRVSAKSESQMRLFERDAYFSLDLRQRALTVRRKAGSGTDLRIDTERLTFVDHDPLGAEIEAFLAAAAGNGKPLVSGEAGLRALQTAAEISRSLGTPG